MANDWRQTVDAVIALQSDEELKTAPGPSLQWYPTQWLGDPAVQLMGMTARGCHHHLLMIAWKGFDLDEGAVPCSVPDASPLLKALCQHPADWEGVFEEIRRGWKARGGRLWNLGLCRSYLAQMAKRRTATASGRAGGEAKAAALASEREAKAGDVLPENVANASEPLANAMGGQANANSPGSSSVFNLQSSASDTQGGAPDLADLADKLCAIIGQTTPISPKNAMAITERLDQGADPRELIWAAQMTQKRLGKNGSTDPISYLCSGPWQAMDGFERFMKTYPEKHRREIPEAARAWYATRKERAEAGVKVLGGLCRHVQSQSWLDDYVPNPAKWIRNHSWNDPAPKRGKPTKGSPDPEYRSLN